MRVSARGEYAIKAMLELALRPEGGLVPIQAIAERQAIPQRYLEQVLLALKRAGLLVSKRGSTGGYHLTRAPEAITVGEILRAAEGSDAAFDAGPTRRRNGGEEADLGELWTEIAAAVSKVVDHVSLADLVARARERRGAARAMYHI
jgi:Rrf2 family protein